MSDRVRPDERTQPLNQLETLIANVDTEVLSIDGSLINVDPAFHQMKHSDPNSNRSIIQREAAVETKQELSNVGPLERPSKRSGNIPKLDGSGDSSCVDQEEQNKLRSELKSRSDEVDTKTSELAAMRIESQKTTVKYEEMLRLAEQAADTMRRERKDEVNALTKQLEMQKEAAESINAHAAMRPPPPSDLEAELRILKEQALKDSSMLSAAILEKDEMKECVKKNVETMKMHQIELDHAKKESSTDRSTWAEEVKILRQTNKSLQGDLENQRQIHAATESSLLNKIKDLMADKSEQEETIAALRTDQEKKSNDSRDIIASNNTAKVEFEKKQKIWLAEKKVLENELAEEKERASTSVTSAQQGESWLAEKAALESALERANEQLHLAELESSDREIFVEMRINGLEIEKEAIMESLNSRDAEISKVRLEKKQLDEELERLQDRLEYNVTTLLNMPTPKSVKRSGSSEKGSKDRTDDLTLSLEEAVSGVQLALDATQKRLSETESKLKDAENVKKGDVADVEHDSAGLGQILAETKIELAMQKCENEELQQTYRKLEKQTCALKLSIASMQEERDDMMAMKHHVDALLSKSTKVLLRR